MKDHQGLLKEAHRVLTKGGKIYCNEVHNATLFIEPYPPAILQFWFQFNDLQFESGDPFVGAKLANLLLEIGFKNVETQIKTLHFDNRKPKTRARILDYWLDLMMSAAPILLEKKRISPLLLRQMEKEFKIIKAEKNSVFYYSFVQAVAYK